MGQSLPRLIYLDQNCWTRLADEYPDTLRWLKALVQQGRVFIPLSQIHIIETFKSHPWTRGRVLQIAREITGDLGLVGPLKVIALEEKRYKRRRPLNWLRARLVTAHMLDLLAPAGWQWDLAGRAFTIRRALNVHERILGQHPGFAAHVDPILRNSVEPLNRLQHRPFRVEDAIETTRGLPRDQRRIREVFPSLTTREALQLARRQVGSKCFEPNDLMDLTFLSVTIPYFDLTVVDHAMHGVASLAIRKFGAPAYADPAVVELSALQRVLQRLV